MLIPDQRIELIVTASAGLVWSGQHPVSDMVFTEKLKASDIYLRLILFWMSFPNIETPTHLEHNAQRQKTLRSTFYFAPLYVTPPSKEKKHFYGRAPLTTFAVFIAQSPLPLFHSFLLLPLNPFYGRTPLTTFTVFKLS